MIKMHKGSIFKNKEKIKKIEILFGGDHGKGAFSFLCIVIVRYKDDDDSPSIFEF